MKKLFTLLFLCGMLCIATISCKKDSNDSTPESLSGNTLTGKITNWSYGSDKKIVAMTDYSNQVGTVPISADGSFTLTLATPDASVLNIITDFIEPTLTYSDASAQVIDLSLYVEDNTSSYFGYLENLNDIHEDTLGFVRVVYLYSNKSTTVKGNVVYSDTDYSETDNFDLTLKAGWNTVSIEYTKYTITGTQEIIEAKVRSYEPSSANWKFSFDKK
jgi:hypothetical protein